MKRADILEAIVRPTLATPVRRFGVPRDVYQFAYEEGLPERLAQDVFKEADEGGLVSGVLPFLQVVCESLLSVTRQRKATTGLLTITHEDYTPGKVLETMTQYVDDVIDAFLREQQTGAIDLARSRWKDVIAFLARTQSDGSMTAQIKTIDELRSIAESFAAPYGDRMLAYLADDERGILRRDAIADPASGTVVERFSLRHDAIGLILSQWRTQRETYQQELVFKDGIRVFMPGVDEIQLTCSFDETGSGAHVRRWIGLRSRQTVLDFRIPYSLGVSPPGRVGALVLTSLDQPQPSALPVRFVVEESHDDRLRGFVEIQGQLGANTGFVGFETRHPIERAFYMKREDIEKGYTRALEDRVRRCLRAASNRKARHDGPVPGVVSVAAARSGTGRVHRLGRESSRPGNCARPREFQAGRRRGQAQRGRAVARTPLRHLLDAAKLSVTPCPRSARI